MNVALHSARTSVGRVTTGAPTREDVGAVVDLACLIALEPDISAAAIRDALIVLESRPNRSAPTIETLVCLSHARSEAWRQLSARGIHADTPPDVLIDAEPLEALAPDERTVLELIVRRGLSYEDAAYVMDSSRRRVRRLRRNAQVAFVRAVTALALAMDLTPCPVRDGLAARGAGVLTRKDINALTLHAAECSICIDWLRRADQHAISGYSEMPGAGEEHIDAVLEDVQTVDGPQRHRVVQRAGKLRRDGRPGKRDRFDVNPNKLLRRAIGFAVTSVLLVLIGLLLLQG